MVTTVIRVIWLIFKRKILHWRNHDVYNMNAYNNFSFSLRSSTSLYTGYIRYAWKICRKVINWFSQNCTKGATPINILHSARWNQRTNPLFNSICHTFRNTARMLKLFFNLVLNAVVLSLTKLITQFLSLSLPILFDFFLSPLLSFPLIP